MSSITENDLKIFKYFDRYERIFSRMALNLPYRKPWLKSDKDEITDIIKNILGIKQEWIPQICYEVTSTIKQDGFSIEFLKFFSWEDTIGTAHLYLPVKASKKKSPFVLLCCGHGQGGKLALGYQAMARRLVKQGAIVLVPDNIGQGERVPMGHSDAVIPFACGVSVQGLIVMETMAWLRWAVTDNRIDSKKIGVIGNSGGGMLALFLGALCPEITVLSSSGYPCTFEYIARKEKKHCHCNILPGIVGKVEMWEILGVYAPKPLFIFQGSGDHFFPEDIFFNVARKVRTVYRELNAEENFSFGSFLGGHSWDNKKRYAISNFLHRELGLDKPYEMSDETLGYLSSEDTCLKKWPKDAMNIDDIAISLSGIRPPTDIQLYDVYPSRFDIGLLPVNGMRGNIIQIFAQYEAFLK